MSNSLQRENIEYEVVEITDFKRLPTPEDWCFFGYVALRKQKTTINRAIIEFKDLSNNKSDELALLARYKRLYLIYREHKKQK
jgi:hypothetical protein